MQLVFNLLFVPDQLAPSYPSWSTVTIQNLEFGIQTEGFKWVCPLEAAQTSRADTPQRKVCWFNQVWECGMPPGHSPTLSQAQVCARHPYNEEAEALKHFMGRLPE